MKKFLIFPILTATAIALVSTFGCKKNTDPDPTILGSPDTLFVKMNETVQIYAGNFSIRLDSVIGDSRCPTDVTCFWEGRVDARFVFTKNGSSILDTLSNGAEVVNWPNDKTAQFGFKIQMLEMKPHPIGTLPIPQVDYVAKLAVLPE